MNPSIAAVVFLLLGSCTADRVVVREPTGLFTFLAANPPEDEREEAGKLLWAFGDVRVTVQRLSRTPYNRDLSVAEMAGALSARFDLEDLEGALDPSPCTADGRAIQCLDGWTELGGGRVQRRGLLFGSDDEWVLVEVLGEGSRVDEIYEGLLQSFRWGNVDG